MVYVESFVLPTEAKESALILQREGETDDIDNVYPCRVFSGKGLREIQLADITILYGGNGSGKSTLLNVVAEKLELNRIAPYNTAELFRKYVSACKYTLGYDEEGFRHRIPNGSRIITSDDIFDYMLTVRVSNEEVRELGEEMREYWNKAHDPFKPLKPRLRGIEDYEHYRQEVLAVNRNVSRRKFIRRAAGEETRLQSNGETALAYFEKRLRNDAFYCLDEPENSLSAKLQLELAKMLEESVRYCGCQLLIATHSPFLLALPGARIYDLDAAPVDIKPWQELENIRVYAAFFQKAFPEF